MIDRLIKDKLLRMTELYPIVTLTGPRQSGKSTLLKNMFPEYKYVTLEDLDNRHFAKEDPRGFLKLYSDKTIFDEVQHVPELFSYIQTHVDEANSEGMYFLSGSQNFALMEKITQSLAGRTALLKLLPFSRREMREGNVLPASIDEEIFLGSYPRLFDKKMQSHEYYPFYLQTYVERDVRTLKNIGDLDRFVTFLKLCAGRIGQLLNLSSLANDCGIAVSTAKAWISVLESSYIVFLLRPDYNNFSKRLVKTPKLYFYDTGLACSLLELESAEQVATHYLRGGLFENLVINEFVKKAYNEGLEPNLSFWRDNKGNEIDLIRTKGTLQQAFEIKSGSTASPDYYKGLKYWSGISGNSSENCFVVYAGANRQITQNGSLITIDDL